MEKELSFEEKVRSFKGRVDRLKEKLGPELVPYAEHWEKEKEKIIEEFIESVIKRFESFESFAGAGTGHLIVDFSLDSLSSLFRDEVEDALVRLKKLGFTVEYFGPDYLPCSNHSINVALSGKKPETKTGLIFDSSGIIDRGVIGH